jgi:hypothetical protein
MRDDARRKMRSAVAETPDGFAFPLTELPTGKMIKIVVMFEFGEFHS